ncbi:glycoside hydrolase family 43 protein [Paenibacillus arenilitoris]|uniref:Family 43 glycosylhydrolase n=1 Tax=Paenibacillus arenilitoris TaxID=2772299 RepID=A0A927H5F8_9BACL|nr:family 43 glycosylhydrolase [Paenibacillus arenilitoris]MBD2869431.1 family 43 glycosylhydrolase [Paenibacillus arenilitoris]
MLSDQTYANPVIEQRADPWVYKHSDGHYYFTASVPEYDRIVLRRAATIQGLADAEEKVLWRRREAGEMSEHVWAPEIHYIEGRWYIYFAAGERDDIWKIRPFVLTCGAADPLAGQWAELGIMRKANPLSEAFTDFSLDMTTFEHRGSRYAIWAEKRDHISNLYIDKLVNPWTIAGSEVMIATPEHPWERIGFWVNEGAAVLKRGGRIFVAYSASATDHHYCMGLLTISGNDDVMDAGAWSKSARPVFESSDETGQYGPGHNSFTQENGNDVIVYHARPYKEIEGNPLYDPNRHARAQVFGWREDGTPDFGAPDR